MNEQTKARIKELQKEKDVVILAHYYVDGEVQEIADYVVLSGEGCNDSGTTEYFVLRCLLYG